MNPCQAACAVRSDLLVLHWLFCRLEQYIQFLLTDDRFLVDGRGVCGHEMIVDGIVEPMELAHLPYRNGKTYEDYLGLRGLERMGKKKWRHYVARIVQDFQAALDADYVVLGGGNVKKIKTLPPKTRLGANGNAFLGGYRLWSTKQGAGSSVFAE